jgi:fatty-acyl-CoA synthase
MTSTPSQLDADERVGLWDASLGDLLAGAARDVADRIALVSTVDDRRWTYAALDVAATRVAQALTAICEPGDRLAIWSTGIPEYVLLQYGAARAGVIIVPLNPAYQAPELKYALDQSGARVIFVGPPVRGRSLLRDAELLRADAPALEHIVELAALDDFAAAADPRTRLHPVASSAAAMIQYTSGTTGTPKGALLTHRGIVNNARASSPAVPGSTPCRCSTPAVACSMRWVSWPIAVRTCSCRVGTLARHSS